ncbi:MULTISPECIES: hypothetical protein [unclassified Neisseria]|uniref:hypothetical protein n=1 Tax=unclassified Neisseria TaxID=2623750 RepID=UPI0026669D3F|nr:MULTISPECIES: hypothetical protein [unclassified Neisseria]MDO1510142.1 hypothetical protein [Neisseria sp. MVDL19-042950]MDO1516718.1 hypothetical protein [Neisseria sp. MVDL18-041461]MDO1563865.1 hypothetical protein [Neisseria sp. MVDL20-010259]
MKKTSIIFAAVATFATAFAAASSGASLPKWNHANDSGVITSLKEVHYQGVKRVAKNDDRVKFVAEATGVRVDNSYHSLKREGNR